MRKKAKTDVLRSNKSPRRAHERHHGVHSNCVIFKKARRPERKYMSHSAKDCTGVRTKHPINDGMRGPIGISTNAVKQYKKSKNNWKK